MLIFLIAQAALAQISAPEATAPQLWRDFTFGMSPEQYADTMRVVPGVASAVVKRDKKNRLKEVKVEYNERGFTIGGPNITITPLFQGDKLQEITLIESDCFGAGVERTKVIRDSLLSKYHNSGIEQVVDESGAPIDKRFALWNSSTRVRVSLRDWAPTQDYVYNSGRGVQGALATIANASFAQDYQAQVNQCPSDSGRRLLISVNYSSQTVFENVHANEMKARQENTQKTKDSL